MGVLKKWGGLFNKENNYAEAKAEHTFDAHADPRIQVEQAIREAQEQHARLEGLVATVVGNQHHAEAVLHRYMDQQDSLEKSIKTALSTNNQDAARSFAQELASVRTNVASQTALVTKATTDAQNAQTQLQENAEALQEAMAKRQTLLSELDQAQMQEQMDTAVTQLTQVGNHTVPTLADVQDKIDQRLANAQGMADVQSTSVEKQAMDVHHAEIQANADSILAEFSAPAADAAK